MWSAVQPFVLHLLDHPAHNHDESLNRDDLLALKKDIGSYTSQAKIDYGIHMIDTHHLWVSLLIELEDKFRGWSASVSQLISWKKATHSELESLVGQLNHAGYGIPMARHFLGILKTALYASRKQITGTFAVSWDPQRPTDVAVVPLVKGYPWMIWSFILHWSMTLELSI
jgi:hypothetical protein